MNEQIKRIATETYKQIPMGNKKPDAWLDEFIIEYSRKLIFECSDVVRENAKTQDEATKTILKSTAVDVLDHFGLQEI